MVNLTKVGVAVGVGVLDEVLEHQDNSAGRTGFKRWSAWARVGVTLAGYMADTFAPRYRDVGETAAVAYTPLLIKTLAEQFPIMGGKSMDFAPRDIGARVRNWVPSDIGNQGGYRPIS